MNILDLRHVGLKPVLCAGSFGSLVYLGQHFAVLKKAFAPFVVLHPGTAPVTCVCTLHNRP